jgi:hypothetical protein
VSILSFKAQVALDDGISRTVAWFRDHHDEIAASLSNER